MKNKLTDLAILWLRIALGVGLMYHGYGKLERGVGDFAMNAVEPMGFPVPLVWAWAAVASELFGGLFVLIGLWTRWAALAGGTVMAVAAFVSQALDPFPQREKAVAYLVVCIFFMLNGAGPFAVHPSGKGGRKSAPVKKEK
ncbi:DoxX family protein [candidate division KSB1 bacterium]|nr:DoxX family protein [candidate division KSB1 bacterium]